MGYHRQMSAIGQYILLLTVFKTKDRKAQNFDDSKDLLDLRMPVSTIIFQQ